jgi:DNA-binding HxlR family transcriptional regulator
MNELMFNPYNRACPSRRLLNEIGELWTVLIVGALSDGPQRFMDISERVDGISYRMLTQTLRTLERDGLVTRTQYPEIPPRVEYELTQTGRELIEPLRTLETWATSLMTRVLQSREEFDGAQAN